VEFFGYLSYIFQDVGVILEVSFLRKLRSSRKRKVEKFIVTGISQHGRGGEVRVI